MSLLLLRRTMLHVLLASALVGAHEVFAQDSIPLAFPVQPKTAPNLTNDVRVSWLRKHAIAVRSVDPSDDDLRDLEPLRHAIGDARVVLLGEGSHGDGTTYLAKTRLIKFLHERMGFDLLAFESSMYDVAKAWQRIRAGEDARTAMARGVFFIPDVQQGIRLIDYIGRRARADRPLEIAGVDPQLAATGSTDFLVHDLKAFFFAAWHSDDGA